MDFLDIRKKAKERAAQARGADAPAARPGADMAPERRGDQEPPARRRRSGDAPPPAAAEIGGADRGEGDIAARLQELPAATDAARRAPPEPVDDRFTTWRPGDGAPPFVPPPPALGPLAPPHDEDFTLFAVPASTLPAAPPTAGAGTPLLPLDPLDDFFYRPDEEAPRLPQLAQAAAPRQDPAVAEREEYLTFLLGAEEYAVAIRCVREIVKAPPVTEVPRAPAHILGVVTVRGEVVAVIDPRRRLGLPGVAPAERDGRVVILDVGDGPCGLLVDGVSNVVRLAPGSIEPCPQGIAGHSSECLAGIGREGERIFTVVDPGALLRAPARAAEGAVVRRTDASA